MLAFRALFHRNAVEGELSRIMAQEKAMSQLMRPTGSIIRQFANGNRGRNRMKLSIWTGSWRPLWKPPVSRAIR